MCAFVLTKTNICVNNNYRNYKQLLMKGVITYVS